MNFLVKVTLITSAVVAAVMAIGIISGVSLFFVIQNAELENAKHDFSTQFQSKVLSIKDTVANTARAVHTVKSLFDIQNNISPYDDFIPFMDNSQSDIVGAYSLGWISHVLNADRGAFVNTTRGFGQDYSSFNIIVKPPGGATIPAPVAPSYNVLQYVYPLPPNLGVLGLNLNAEPVRANTLKRSTASMLDAVSSIIYLPHAKYQQPGVLYLSPSYTNSSQLDGFGVGVFIIGDMIQSAMSEFMSSSTLMVFDAGFKNISDATLIQETEDMWVTNGYNTSSFLWASTGEYGPDFGSQQHIDDTHKQMDNAGFIYIYPISIGDRVWDLVISPSAAYTKKFDTGLKWVGLVCAVAIAVFVSFIISSIAGGLYIRQRNEKKIHDLEIQTAQRQAEDYKKLFNSVAKIENARKHILNTIPDLIVVVNKYGRIIYSNTSFASILGYSDVEINNDVNISSIFASLDTKFFQSIMKIEFEETTLETRMKQQVPVSYCSFLLDIDEKEFQLDESIQGRISSASEVKKSSGVYVIVSRDLRDTKALQGELQNNRAILQQFISSSEFEKRWEEDKGTEHGRLSLDLMFGFRQKFLQFCIKNHCDENVYFLRDVEKYKDLADYDQRAGEQHVIMNTYIRTNGHRQLNLMAHLQKEMEARSKRSHGEIDLFDKIVTAVKTIIINDIYPRYTEEENKRSSSTSISNTMSTASTK